MNFPKRFINLAIFLVLAMGPAHGAFAANDLQVYDKINQGGGLEQAPDEFVVKFKASVVESTIREINGKHGTHVLSTSRFAGFKRLRVPPGKSVDAMVEAYRRNPNVEYAEPNYIVSALLIPNDPLYKYQWHLDNSGTGGIRMQSAWDVNNGGSPSVIVAILDTGVAYEDFGTNFKKAPDLAQTTFVAGYDFIANDSHPNDENSHGTHVCGTIAQSTNNFLGVAGVAYKTSIMPVRVLNRNGSGTWTQVADGIYFATNNGAKVISMSLGGGPSTTLENAVAYAYNHGVTVVAAAGNDGPNGAANYPAAYDAYVIAVAATRYDEAVAAYSTQGSYVDVAAPGGDTGVDQNGDGYADGVLQQTFNPNTKNTSDFGYWFFQGTSMATPHVSGLAALLIAKGFIGPDAIREAIEKTARDRGPAGKDNGYGWGLIDANVALNYTPTPAHDVAVSSVGAPASVIQGDSAAVSVNVSNLGSSNETFTVTLTDTTDNVTIGSQGVTVAAGGSQSVSFTWNTSGASLGSHALKGEASTVSGETNTANNSATTTSNVQLAVHDVAVTGLNAPASVTAGDSVNVQVTVADTGTYPESTTVTLLDGAAPIGSQTVNLAAGASTVLTFVWNTTGASIGNHLLKATAATVVGETNTVDNELTSTVNVKQPVAETITVTSAVYRTKNGQLRVDATDSLGGTVTLTVSSPSTGYTYGPMTYNASSNSFTFSANWQPNPGSQVKVTSSKGASATAPVIKK